MVVGTPGNPKSVLPKSTKTRMLLAQPCHHRLECEVTCTVKQRNEQINDMNTVEHGKSDTDDPTFLFRSPLYLRNVFYQG